MQKEGKNAQLFLLQKVVDRLGPTSVYLPLVADVSIISRAYYQQQILVYENTVQYQ